MIPRLTIFAGPALLAIAALASPAVALPDAAVARIAVGGTDLRDGDRVPVEVELANRGDRPLPPVPVVLNIDDEPYAGWKPSAPIAPGKSAIWSLLWSATRGSHLVVAVADPLNDVAESDETNNSAFVNVGVGDAREPSPWPVAIAGIAALLVGFGAAMMANRLRPSAKSGQRYAIRWQRGGPSPPQSKR
jgi:hypothetical protein